MLFRKKKKMVDLRELQKRGVVRIPNKNIIIPTNNNGFVELLNSTPNPQTSNSSSNNASFFGFMDKTSSEPTPEHRLPNTDNRITDLDNKIYKLEQRIELLEKKLDINQSTNNVGVMGW